MIHNRRKKKLPIVFKEKWVSNITFVSDLHPSKDLFSIVLTEEGIVIFFKMIF